MVPLPQTGHPPTHHRPPTTNNQRSHGHGRHARTRRLFTTATHTHLWTTATAARRPGCRAPPRQCSANHSPNACSKQPPGHTSVLVGKFHGASDRIHGEVPILAFPTLLVTPRALVSATAASGGPTRTAATGTATATATRAHTPGLTRTVPAPHRATHTCHSRRCPRGCGCGSCRRRIVCRRRRGPCLQDAAPVGGLVHRPVRVAHAAQQQQRAAAAPLGCLVGGLGGVWGGEHTTRVSGIHA